MIKYGFPIGIAYKDISKGERVHTDNISTALGEKLESSYTPDLRDIPPQKPAQIRAYVRENGDVGIRNDIWIIPTVGLRQRCGAQTGRGDRSGRADPPLWMLLQLGGDHALTQKAAPDLLNHPNAAGVRSFGSWL